MAFDFLRHLVDIVLCVALLRLALGALLRYKHLTRLMLTLGVIFSVIVLIRWVRLPLASYLSLAVLVPAAIVLVLNALPELMRVYKGALKSQVLLGPRTQAHEVIRAIGLALRELAHVRHGALFVFPQQDDVSGLIHGGEEVDFRVNAAMLRSMFNPACPRHDGAMIVRGDRVLRIGAVLPLATGDNVDPSWGTRHLAALGLSQRCDADVVVVSEERGVVSHMKKGAVQTLGASDEELARLLRTIYQRLPKSREETRARAVSLGLWAASIALAVLGSFYIDVVRTRLMPSEAAVSVHEAPIELINLPDTLVVDDLPPRARVQVTVPEDQTIVRITPALRIVIDMEGTAPGRVARPLRREMVRDLPAGWSVDRITPAEVRFNLLKR